MTLPSSTYRLQFRNGMDFAKAIQLVPYLRLLGISHLYASPVMTAVGGSSHGYDAVRMDEVDPALGGIGGLRRLAAALHERQMGLLLDIVPNHMAASLENPWWRSIVVWGKESPFAHYFDIDWGERLTLPILSRDFSEEVAEGKVSLALEPGGNALALKYDDTSYPLHPESYRDVLGASHSMASHVTPSSDPQGRAILPQAFTSPTVRARLERQLADITSDPIRLTALHDAQPWQLVDWKTANRNLSYRRFFEIAGLACLRVEEDDVFEESHRLVLQLLHEGTIDGLRIDHIDGLADPSGYLDRLRAATGPDSWIVVEKILERDEPLPAEWPVAGTTGYEFIAAISGVFVDEAGKARLSSAFQSLKIDDGPKSYADEMVDCKQQMLTDNFENEVRRLGLLAKRMADVCETDFSRTALTEAIRALIVALPVYRTYMVSGRPITPRDHHILATARAEAQACLRPEVREAVDFVWELLTDDRTGQKIPACIQFRTRFQQLTGPIMAKAVEDTLFYRENGFIALNEVGGDPGRATGTPADFHAAMRDRVKNATLGLSATSSHDTKRGEDARARLYALSEAPDEWIAATRRWTALYYSDQPKPEADIQWLVYQTIAGIWPIDGRNDRAAMAALPERMSTYIRKALREAKRKTNWSEPDFDYEDHIVSFVENRISDEAFIEDFARTLSPFIDAGLSNALVQALIKLTAPGIPDIYQGSERNDFSLVDPDNRMPLDMTCLRIPEKPTPERSSFSDYKLWMTATVLSLRRQRPDAFLGPYLPLAWSDDGRQALAFLRGDARSFAITVVPRFAFGRTGLQTLCLSPEVTGTISLHIPTAFEGRTVRSVLDDRILKLSSSVPLSDLLRIDPVALLVSI